MLLMLLMMLKSHYNGFTMLLMFRSLGYSLVWVLGIIIYIKEIINYQGG